MVLNFKSDPSFKERRLSLINKIRNRGKVSERVLSAMAELPRELFVNRSFVNRAYEDHALPISCDQTISQPYTVAYMTSLLDPKETEKILEIGTGSGYQASLIGLLGANVISVERINELYEKAKELFQKIGMSIQVYLADGTLGFQEMAPYDGIIVTAAAPDIPKELIKQLKIGGRLIIPIGDKSSQVMHKIIRINEKEIEDRPYDRFQFVPLIGEHGW